MKKDPHPEEAAQAAVSKDALRRSSRLGILAQPDRSDRKKATTPSIGHMNNCWENICL
jgi:hypothetical protein